MTSWATVALLLTASSAYSEVVPIISGDQSDFPRFVATIPRGTDWKIQQEQGKSIIELPEGFRFEQKNPDAIGAGEIYAKLIDRERRNQIEVSFECDCRIDVYVYQDVFLVIDILNVFPEMIVEKATSNGDIPNGAWWRDLLVEATPNYEVNQVEAPLIQEPDSVYIPEFLARELSTAATSGRIELHQKSDGDREPTNATANDIQTSILSLNIGIDTTSSDAQGLNPITPDTACNAFRSAELFGSTVEEIDFETLIATRKLVFSETGNSNDERMVSLALQYLELGLEIEASQILDQVSTKTEEVELLKQIAKLLQDHIDTSDFWQRMQRCENSNYLWYALSMKGVSENDIKSDLVLLHFKALPRWLRQHVTARLHDMLIRNNEYSSAAEILSFSDVATEASVEKTESALQSIPTSEIKIANRDQPEVMLDILALNDHHNATGISEAIRFEHQGTPLWFELLEAEIVSLLNSNNYSGAIRKLEEFQHEPSQDRSVDGIANRVFSEISQNANDTDFLAAFFLRDDWPLTEDTLELLSDRMVEFQILDQREASDQPATGKREQADEPIELNLDAALDPPSPESFSTLNSTEIRELLDDTQALRSSILSQLSSIDR